MQFQANSTVSTLNMEETKEEFITVPKEEYERIVRENNRLRFQLDTANDIILQLQRRTVNNLSANIDQSTIMNDHKQTENTGMITEATYKQKISRIFKKSFFFSFPQINTVSIAEPDQNDDDDDEPDQNLEFLDEIYELHDQYSTEEYYQYATPYYHNCNIYSKGNMIDDKADADFYEDNYNEATPLVVLSLIYDMDISNMRYINISQQYDYLLSQNKAQLSKVFLFMEYHKDTQLSQKTEISNWNENDIMLSFISYVLCTKNNVSQSNKIWEFASYLWSNINAEINTVSQFFKLNELQQKERGLSIINWVCNKFELQTSPFANSNVKQICGGWSDELYVQLNGMITDDQKIMTVLKAVDKFASTNESIDDEIRIMTIPEEKCTELVIKHRYIYQDFKDKKRLFRYLFWRIKMVQIDGLCKIFASADNSYKLVIIKVDVNTRIGQNDIYMVGFIDGLCESMTKDFCKYLGLMTAPHIDERFNICNADLPDGSVYDNKACLKTLNYPIFTLDKLNIIRTQSNSKAKKKELIITPHKVENGLNNNIDRDQFIAIVSFLLKKGKTRYFYDLLCPINIENNNFIAVAFRNGEPTLILFDWYDIINKAMLFNPNFDQNRVNMFKNDYANVRYKKN